MQERVRDNVFESFRLDRNQIPAITLRGGNAIDDYGEPPPYDPVQDAPTDEYLERYAFHGLGYLDPGSWRHYLPCLVDYAFRHQAKCESMVVDGLISSLRPPDRNPPRLESLTPAQEEAMRAFLEEVALGEDSDHDRDLAMQVLEEWWLPNAMYRRRG